ncbi:uncharacterized protein [Typha latifolia]|uniref:uncharacterized protein n=1 Tax=Typha latifolia TaxID=4733 RepID=UPI003C2C6FB3
MEYDKWAERIKSDQSQFVKSTGTIKSGGAWSRRAPTNPQPKPIAAPLFPIRGRIGDFNHLHPSPRAQAIERHRHEMLEMVRAMPEAAYELSLRDLVESQPVPTPAPMPKPEPGLPAVEEAHESPKNKEKKEKKRRMRKRYYLDPELLVKLFMPLAMGDRKKRLSSFSSSAKISPKPMAAEGKKDLDHGQGWKIKTEKTMMVMMSEEGSSTTSSSSSSSITSKMRSASRKMKGCCSFFKINRSKSRES